MFCMEYVKTGNKSEAYRIAYDAENMKPETINKRASELFDNGGIRGRVQDLKSKVEKKQLYTLEQSIKRDLKLIKRYEDALNVLEWEEATTKDIEVAERTIKYISISGYNSAQDRIAKQSGFYEKDNNQKNTSNILFLDVDEEDDKL